MAQIEAVELNPEHRIILVDSEDNTVEIKPSRGYAKFGAALLSGIRTLLVTGVDKGLFETNPFVLTQSQLPASDSE